jgi:diketogulonate reductase-like aldo/keto reductase
MTDINTTVALNDGNTMPQLGFGVFEIKDLSACEGAVRTALDAGYRHIDTAAAYGNEGAVGKAIKESGIDRDKIFVTTKVFVRALGTEKTRTACEDSLAKLGMDYVDLYLIHWPVREGVKEAWETMQKLKDEGKIKSIGVSNFTVRRFEDQFFKSTDVVPAVNQIELHPFCTRTDLLAYCEAKGIQAEGYSPLARARRLDDPVLNELAAKYDKSVAHVMIRWQLQLGVAVIPKSQKEERIRQNADVFDFEIDAEDMKKIGSLDEEMYTISWRPEPDWF